MSESEESREVLLRLFQRKKIISLEEMLKTLKRSRMTVLRRLSAIDYLASCSHAGKFYTLKNTLEFDQNGIWRHLGVLFSREGTLKQTLKRLVEDSEDGRFQAELQRVLELRVHNTLGDLVDAELLGREVIASEFLYVSAKKMRAKEQISRRSQALAAAPKDYPLNVIIEILLDVIHSAKAINVDSVAIAKRLVARGITIAADAVSKILQDNGVVKKTARSRSKHSRS